MSHKEQTSIPKHKIARAARLAGTGAKVGANYLKYHSKRVLTGDDSKVDFHRVTAADTYETFSHLKGGPLKLAQMLSMDQNLLPDAYTKEFSKAQYSAPPLSYPLVVKTFQRETGKKPTEIFDDFTKNAVAGASIGQVHKATKDGKTYAVKVQYPGVGDSVKSDLRIVKPIAMRLFQLDERAMAPYINEVQDRLLEETDYKLELKRSVELIEASGKLKHTRFPEYFPELSSGRILTMEWVEGDLLDVYAKNETDQDKRDTIAKALWDFYHHQIHNLNVFHADPHPGNFKVHNDELWVLDFGCVKELPESFYKQYFALMDPENLHHDGRFDTLLRALNLLLPDDSPSAISKLRSVFRESVTLLSRPFHNREFDFSDQSYFDELASFGERTRQDRELQMLNTARGQADALYLNRTYFGLYHLAGSLGAKIKTDMPTVAASAA